MTRRIKRRPEFDIELNVKDDNYIRPPNDGQRNWLLNTALSEFVADLEALDSIARTFVPGTPFSPAADRTQAELSDGEIMEDWQIPLMRAMANIVAGPDLNVLEIGFGRGVSSQFIQEIGVASHTIIECNDSVVDRFSHWRAQWPDRDIRMVHGLWQDVLSGLGQFDGVFFHTYPLNETDFVEQIAGGVTFAEHFFEHAALHLVEGGVFTYLVNEIDSLSRAHQRSLFRFFQSIEISVIRDLGIPEQVRDAWWAPSMAVVRAVR